MAIVKAPGGRKYDTVRRVFLDEPIGNSSSTVFTPSIDTVYRRPRSNNIWERISNSISGIGDWFDYNATTFSNNISFIFYIIAWISLGIAVIGQWISSGLWTALITAVIGGIIVYYAAGIAMVILMYILWGCFKVMRYIFYNIYILLITVAILIAIIFSNQINIHQNRTTTTSNPVSDLSNYYCDVNTTLNVREHPRSNSRVIGQLKRYDEVYVHSIDNSFAKIDFNGSIAYVSANYLKPKDLSSNTTQYVINEKFSDEQKVENKVQTALNTGLVNTKYKDFQELRNRFNELGMYTFIEGGIDDYPGYYLYAYSAVRNNYAAKYSRFFLIKYYDENSIKIVDELSFDRNRSDMINFLDLHDNNSGMNKMKFARYRDIEDGVNIVSFYEIDTENNRFIAKPVTGNWSLNIP